MIGLSKQAGINDFEFDVFIPIPTSDSLIFDIQPPLIAFQLDVSSFFVIMWPLSFSFIMHV